jgi:hypothetical protein
MFTRRDLVEAVARGAIVAGGAASPSRTLRALACDAAVPPSSLFDTDPERYWAKLRSQWVLAADRINLNSGALGCTPIPVLRATMDHLVSAEEFREPELPWFGYAENARIRTTREALAAFLNCKLDELALTRNCTEGNNKPPTSGRSPSLIGAKLVTRPADPMPPRQPQASTSRTLAPSRAAQTAAAEPAGPPPATSTS